jgi:cytochrome P450
MKETLRMHPIIFMGTRQAVEDQVIPLSQPLKLSDGRSITEIPVSKGQNIWINFPGYNRLPSIFGENAHEFNVDRWLDNRLGDLQAGSVGVYGNLITFSHGPRACIGENQHLDSLRVTRAYIPQGGDSLFTRYRPFSSSCWRTSSSAYPRITEV